MLSHLHFLNRLATEGVSVVFKNTLSLPATANDSGVYSTARKMDNLNSCEGFISAPQILPSKQHLYLGRYFLILAKLSLHLFLKHQTSRLFI